MSHDEALLTAKPAGMEASTAEISEDLDDTVMVDQAEQYVQEEKYELCSMLISVYSARN